MDELLITLAVLLAGVSLGSALTTWRAGRARARDMAEAWRILEETRHG